MESGSASITRMVCNANQQYISDSSQQKNILSEQQKIRSGSMSSGAVLGPAYRALDQAITTNVCTGKCDTRQKKRSNAVYPITVLVELVLVCAR